VKVTLEFEEDSGQIMVFCRELGVVTSGKDIPEAFEMIGDACAVYWGTLENLGEEDVARVKCGL